MKKMSTATDSAAQENEKTWKWIEARLWQNTQSGIYCERPTVNGRPMLRSLKTRNRKHAVEELFKRRSAVGAGEDPYAEPKAVTVGEVIHHYLKTPQDTAFVVKHCASSGWCRTLHSRLPVI